MQHLDTYQVASDGRIAYPTDPSSMIEDINNLALHCKTEWIKAKHLQLPFDKNSVEQVVFAGMGGSAITGDILASLITTTSPIPFIVSRSYLLPGFVNEKTLVIASSHSGETEETLACFEAASKAGAKLLAFGGGGRLTKLANERKVPIINYKFAGQPRAAFGHAFTALLGIAFQLGLIPDPSTDIEEACSVVEQLTPEIGLPIPTEHNTAKQLAILLHERIPYIYAGPLLGKVAHRWKNQFNENSKTWAGWDELPEMNHNTVASYDHPALWSKAIILFIKSIHDDARIAARLQATEELLRQRGIAHSTIHTGGESKLAQIYWMVHFSDYVSYYLASLYQTDPTRIEAITQLKARLLD